MEHATSASAICTSTRPSRPTAGTTRSAGRGSASRTPRRSVLLRDVRPPRDDVRHDHRPQHASRARCGSRDRPRHVPLGRGDDAVPRGRRPAARPRLEPDRGRTTATCSPTARRSTSSSTSCANGASCTRSRTRCTGWARRSPSSHVERMMLLFSVWEGRNGARPESSNTRRRRARRVGHAGAARAARRPARDRAAPRRAASRSPPARTITARWTSRRRSPRRTRRPSRSSSRRSPRGGGTIAGEHGSSVKLAHAVGALALNAYRASGRSLPPLLDAQVASLFDGRDDGPERHDRIVAATSLVARGLSDGARARRARPRRARRLSASASARCCSPARSRRRSSAPCATTPRRAIGVRELQRELQRELLGGARARTRAARARLHRHVRRDERRRRDDAPARVGRRAAASCRCRS